MMQPPKCNPFLLLRGEEPEGLPKRLYATLDQADLADTGVHHLVYAALDAD
jgi:hypothetical protein